ncbi:MAG: rod-binding protein [Rhodospirillales bacterium]|nr:rod-binding protein [Rhodospirillales bacterium]
MDAGATIRAITPIAAASPAAQPGAARATPLPLASHPDPAAVAAAARKFEAVFIGQMLGPIFATLDTAHGPFGGGAGEEAWKPMLVDAVADKIAAAGGFGLAAAVEREMLRMQEARQP